MICSDEMMEVYRGSLRSLRTEELETRTIKVDDQFTLTVRLNKSLWAAFEIMAEGAKGDIDWEGYILSYWEHCNWSHNEVDQFIDELIAYILSDNERAYREIFGYANDNVRCLPSIFNYPDWMRYTNVKREHLRG